MKAKTIKGSSTEEIKNALAICMADGYKPTLAILFISIKQDRNAVWEVLHQQGMDMMGATSSGEFIDGHQSDGEIVVMLFDIRREYYCILFEDIGNRSLDEAATNLVEAALQKFDKPAFILCSTLFSPGGKILDGESLIHSMEKTAGPGVNIFGGMAGDDITFTGTYVFTNARVTDYGIAALVLDEDKIGFYGMSISGWKPVGLLRTVTKSEGNLIYKIDNQPALEVYLRYLGEDRSSADDQLKFFDTIGIHYPFQIERENREPKMCNPMGYDKEKMALMCESDVPQGSRFRFSTPPDFDIVETVIQKATEFKNESLAEADALLIFSCVGRLNALGPMAQQENEGLAATWNVPMAGFYTYGEFGRASNGKHEFHSTTCCWVALKEK